MIRFQVTEMIALRYLTAEQREDPHRLKGTVEYYWRAISNGLGSSFDAIGYRLGIYEADVSDLKQELYVHLHLRAEDSPHLYIGSPDSYIYTAFVNECWRFKREESLRKSAKLCNLAESRKIAIMAEETEEVSSLEEKEELAIAMAAINSLDKKLSGPILVHYCSGLTYSEASEFLGIPKGTVQSRAHTGIRDIRALLGLD